MRWLRLAIAVAAGWGSLLVLLYLGSEITRWTAVWLGAGSAAGWIPTLGLTLNCFELAAAGFVAGRSSRARPVLAVLAFAATIAVIDFGEAMPMNVRWLIRLSGDAIQDSRFFDSWLTTLGAHALLFGSLVTGGMLSRPQEKPVSLAVN